MSKGWQHFTSWWVYPAGLGVLVILLVAPALGVSQFWDGLVMRLFVLGFVLVGAYDRRVRTPRRLKEQESHKHAHQP